ncbi:MAG: 5'-deoxynucleotidase [Clostridiaceae bacterium]|nr:5'-deoxynucleotidase [Clostridiaceae bacterium]
MDIHNSDSGYDQQHSFFAMIDRMQYINRWGLMRNNRTENLKEHSMDVAVVAHALATIRKTYFPENHPQVDPLQVMGIALFHDASEIITGDLPTPIKYRNDEIRNAYKKVENQASLTLLGLLPEPMRKEYAQFFCNEQDDCISIETYKIVKAADRICAYIKCISEEMTGNKEFLSAKATVIRSIERIELSEVDYFMQHFLPAYGKSLDEITDVSND